MKLLNVLKVGVESCLMQIASSQVLLALDTPFALLMVKLSTHCFPEVVCILLIQEICQLSWTVALP